MRLGLKRATLLLAGASALDAQEWRTTAAHLTTTARVLLVGARPDDEDNALIAWLSRGRHLDVAVLSVTRGEGSDNVAGGEREAPLAVVRTAEAVAERERDGARQFFTRAYDPGVVESDSMVAAQWPGDAVLLDMVSVIRGFRPHVVISLVSASDSSDAVRRHVARLVTRAVAAASDTGRAPASTTARLPAWRPGRLLALDSSGTVRIDVGEFDRTSGRSFAEIGADIRRLQRTQPLPRRPTLGPQWRMLRIIDASSAEDQTLFAGLDTSLVRLDVPMPAEARAQYDTLLVELGAVSGGAATADADEMATRFARVARRTAEVRVPLGCRDESTVPTCAGGLGDLSVTLGTIRERATRAMLDAAGVVIEGTVGRQFVALGDSVPVTLSAYNGGAKPVVMRRLAVAMPNGLAYLLRDTALTLLPDSITRHSRHVILLRPTMHWWQINGMIDGTLLHAWRASPGSTAIPQHLMGEDRIISYAAEATVSVGGVDVPVIVRPLVHGSAVVPRGDVRRPLIVLPPTSVLMERFSEYVRAGPMARVFRVQVSSARSATDTIEVSLNLPPGLRTDTASRRVVVEPLSARSVFFRVWGALPVGAHRLSAAGQAASALRVDTTSGTARRAPVGEILSGAVLREYPHIPTQKFVRFAEERLEVVDLRVPPRLNVAYVRGSEDLRAAMLQLDLRAQVFEASLLPAIDLRSFSAVLLGIGSLAVDGAAGAIPALRRFVEAGGTLVLLSSGTDDGAAELLPFPVHREGQGRRIADVGAPIRIVDRTSAMLGPNHLSDSDFAGWVGDRARGVPERVDARYGRPFAVRASRTSETDATVLIGRLGRGTVVYTTLNLAAQLEASHPGAARLLVNMLSAQASTRSSMRR